MMAGVWGRVDSDTRLGYRRRVRRKFYRMILCGEREVDAVPPSVNVRRYCAKRDHEAIRSTYGQAFGDPPWPPEWDSFDEFDANGAFVAEDARTGAMVGFALCFQRSDYGYISVVAVTPSHRRQGVAFSLVRRAIRYLRSIGLETVKVDAITDAVPAVNLYKKIGFQVESTFEDDDDLPGAR